MTASLLLGDLRALIPAPWSEMLLVAASFACGALVGIERQRQEKPAGLRTLLLICVGSTIFTVASLSVPLSAGEPGRIAAQIVTGVGFLGAGSILRERFGVIGLTTAATIWATAGVGIVVGAGYPVPGLALAATILVALTALRRVEDWIGGRCLMATFQVGYDRDGGKTRVRLQRIIDEAPGPTTITEERTGPGEQAEVVLRCCLRHREHRAVLAAVADLPSVRTLEPRDLVR